MKASVILGHVRDALSDPDADTWTDYTLFTYMNQAMLALATARPDAVAVTAILTLVAGCKQALPADGMKLLSIYRNLNSSNAPIAPVVRHIERMTLDDVLSAWQTAAASATVYEYWYDERQPRQFWTNPVSGTPKIEVSYAKSPTVITAGTQDLPVDDIYTPALQEWMLYLAWRRDDESSPTHNRAMAHRAAFFDLLGIKAQGDQATSPKTLGA